QAIKLWDPNTGQRVGRVPAEGSLTGQGMAMAFSADSKLLAIAVHKGQISFWDPATGKQAGSLDAKGAGGYESIYYLRFAPGGRTLVSMGFGREDKEHICHWDLATRTLSRRVDVPKRGGTVVLSEDGQTVAAPAGGGIVRIWDSTTAKERCVLQG